MITAIGGRTWNDRVRTHGALTGCGAETGAEGGEEVFHGAGKEEAGR